ncbi:hypothetical protein STEG23_020192, partial [Scotinomys teguina]
IYLLCEKTFSVRPIILADLQEQKSGPRICGYRVHSVEELGAVPSSQDPHGKAQRLLHLTTGTDLCCLIRNRKFEKLSELLLLCFPFSTLSASGQQKPDR